MVSGRAGGALAAWPPCPEAGLMRQKPTFTTHTIEDAGDGTEYKTHEEHQLTGPIGVLSSTFPKTLLRGFLRAYHMA